jgi:muramoyltetrapeptide carboxypeptidase
MVQQRTIRPKASTLKQGDTIGLIAPASKPQTSEKISGSVRYFESLGYRVTLGKHIEKQYGYLAGTDDERAEDLHQMFRDKNVKAIFFLRGGYGSIRLLTKLDYDLIARNPKIIVGYSDATSLFHALLRKAGLRSCFFGPMPAVDMWNGFDPFAEECMWRMLTSSERNIVLPLNDDEGIEIHSRTSLNVVGNLFGGNLTVLSSMMGTSYMPSLHNRILLFEDIGEPPYRIDRYLAQLNAAGILDTARAVLIGQFTDCIEPDTSKPTFDTNEVLGQYFSDRRYPVLLNIPFGHVRRQWTLPLGARVALDGQRKFEITSPLKP